MRSLVKRNLLVYFRDRSTVCFSLLSVFIIIGLYVLFLGDLMVKNLQNIEGVRFLMDTWIMAGLLAVTPISTAMGSLQTMVLDKRNNIYKDFAAAPVKRSALAGGYIISTFIISLVMSLINLALAEGYIVLKGGELLTMGALVQMLGMIVLTTMSISLLLFFIVTLFKSVRVFSMVNSIIGTLVGFLTGILIPIGNLPASMQAVVKIFPFSHSALLFRNIMMAQPEKISFAGAPVEVLKRFELTMGSVYRVGDWILETYSSIIYLVIISIIAFLLSVRQISKKDRVGL